MAIQETQPLLSRREGQILVLTNNNPTARNALTPAFFAALPEALADAEAKVDIAAIVLTGAGGNFCSGGDLNQLATRQKMLTGERRSAMERLHILIRSVRNCSKPVVAAVDGAAAGAGLSLALACDMLVATRRSSFTMAYVKVGLTPDGGATSLLAELVTRQILTELCLSGGSITGERLHELGAINRLTEAESALPEAIALAERIATGPQRAMARIKKLCRTAHEHSFSQQLEQEAEYMVESLGDQEAAEGIAAFLGKRRPDFSSLRRQPPQVEG